ncbi:MAG: hypothetical protein ACI9UT_002840 [Flavobacteriales bacterium]|jgi:hypothetical protein
MDRKSKFEQPIKAMQTVCVGGVFIIDKRIGYDRRLIIHKCKKEYERRLSHWANNFKRRRQFINIII